MNSNKRSVLSSSSLNYPVINGSISVSGKYVNHSVVNIEVDDTLTVSGAAADAKITGEKIKYILSGEWINVIDEETIDEIFNKIFVKEE